MSASQQQWLLKVIAGPHQGAEIGLYAGKTLVGSDDECDVVLHDVLVAPQHVELDFSATGIVAAPLGGRAFINGKRIREARQAVPAFAFLSIGGSQIVVGPAEGQWPLLSAADVPELEKEVEAPASPEADSTDNSASPDVEAKPTLKPIASSGGVTPTTSAPSPASKLGPMLGIAAGIMLLLGWAVVYNDFFSSRSREDKVAEVSDSPLVRAQAVVEELGLLGSVKVEESAGRLTATGYVDSDARQRELQATLRGTVPGVRTKIYSLEKIASSARTLIDAQRLPLTVSSLSEGNLKVSGKLTSADPWIRMKQTLLSEVPGISDIEDSVEIEASRPGISVPPIAASIVRPVDNPSSSVSSTGQPQTIAPAQTSAVSASAPAVSSTATPVPDPSTDYLISQDTIDTPDASVAAIRADAEGLGFIRLNTGGVYFKGARLPYGGTVAKIETDSVTIFEKGESRTLHLGDAAIKPKTVAAP